MQASTGGDASASTRRGASASSRGDASASTRQPQSLALGVWLATRGALARASLGLAALGALVSIAAAMAMRGTPGVRTIPVVAAAALAWGAGSTLAFGAGMRAIRLDVEQGVVALARGRGVGALAYARGRVGGLVVVLAIAIGGSTLVAGLAATAVAGADRLAVGRAALAALVYALAFAVTLGPVAIAALGGPSRGGGYLALLAVLVLPEVMAPWTGALLPRGWRELTSIPAALDAVRNGVQGGAGSGAAQHAARAAVGLLAVVAASLMVVHARIGQERQTRAGEERGA